MGTREVGLGLQRRCPLFFLTDRLVGFSTTRIALSHEIAGRGRGLPGELRAFVLTSGTGA